MRFFTLTFVCFLILTLSLTGQIKIHKHITSADGLVHDFVQVIKQDKEGYLWIGTFHGLSRWDGINFVNFYKHNGLSSSLIRDIGIGQDSSIYVATYGGGINIIKDGKISVLDESDGLLTNRLLCVYILPNGNVLFGGAKGNISLLKDGKLSAWLNPEKLNRKDVYQIFQSSDSTFYIGTFQGGFYTLKNSNLKNFSFKDGLVNDNVYYFFENDDKSVYISTNLGIHLFKEGEITYLNKKWGLEPVTFRNIESDGSGSTYFASDLGLIEMNHGKRSIIGTDNGLSFTQIKCFFIDQYGTIYIGTAGNGIDIYQPGKLEIFNSQTGLHSDKVWSVYEDLNSNLLLGTQNGLGILDDAKFDWIELADYNYGNVAKDILRSQDGKLYIGTTYGINVLSGGINKKYTKSDGLIDTYILDIDETPDGKILAATRYGVVVFENGKISNLTTSDGLLDDYVLSILVTKDSTIYFGTNGKGISAYRNSIFKNITQDDGLSDLTIKAITEDERGNIYFGTAEGGINILQNNLIRILDMNDGLSSNYIQAIMVSDDLKIYASTNRGLNIIESLDEELKVRIIDSESGLPSNLCLDKALKLDSKGFIWIGTANGLVKFNTKKDFENKEPPRIHITGIQIYNESFSLKEFLNNSELPYDQNYLKFNFAGINLSAPAKINYEYKLVGVDDNWVRSAGNSVQYTNLGTGSYSFEVKAMNEWGYWSDPATVSFIINPPFWETWWAYVIYVVFALTGFLAIRKYELNRVKLKNELKLKEFESLKLQEIDQIKSRFFANISHEFRTPLTIILGSMEKLKQKMEESTDEKEFRVMKRNASRLLQLINQLLELSKIESGNVKLSAQENDIVRFLKRLTASFSSIAHQKQLILLFNGIPAEDTRPDTEILIYFDKKKLETVFYNLLTNAIKFTPVQKTVNVSISKTNDSVKIYFFNEGIEISEDNLTKIFDRFYQVDDSGRRNFEGTGIGLSLVKEYVELHKGNIEVDSKNNNTTFIVSLPLGKSHLKEEEIEKEQAEDSTDVSDQFKFKPEIVSPSEIINTEQFESDKTIILIVEDNQDLREMIKENLQDNYSILEAENGKQGLKLAEKTIPDLVISDIMMPEMDGYELSRRIKSNICTNHIPVILLTARATTEDKLEGLETGADDYLIKPFNENELKVRVKNLITVRRQMREKYQSQMLIQPSEVIVPSTQKIFIEKLTQTVEKNLSNDNFSVELLCREIGISRAQLHRKIRAVTNQSSSEFIRNFRLQRAAELLKKEAGNIAEISYQVGFSSQAYFTKLFQELYGKTPLEFKKIYRK